MPKKIHRRKKNNANRALFFVGVGIALIGVMAVLLLLFGKKDEAEFANCFDLILRHHLLFSHPS